jgi:hypothetical protein
MAFKITGHEHSKYLLMKTSRNLCVLYLELESVGLVKWKTEGPSLGE